MNHKMPRSFAIGLAILVSPLTFSAETISITPEHTNHNIGYATLGAGYYENEAHFNFTTCMKGRKILAMESKVSKPYTSPFVRSLSDDEVRVTVYANTSARMVQTLLPPYEKLEIPAANFRETCGDRFLAEIHIGAQIAISRTFQVDRESRRLLMAILRSQVTDLPSMVNFDVSRHDLKISGSGYALSGYGQTKELWEKLSTCFWNSKGCNEFVEQAYADAKSLDERFPASRVEKLILSSPRIDDAFGDAILYRLMSY